MKQLSAAFRWIVRWFEDGDLVPLLVVVSAAHYISILSRVDPWFVALPLGVLVDLGHYRSVNIAARYSGTKWHQYAIRWIVAVGLTVISGAYHLRYYNGDWALALPIPALIVSLAYFRQMSTKAVPVKRTESPETHAESTETHVESTQMHWAPQPETEPRNGNGKHPHEWRQLAVQLHELHPEWTRRQIAESCGVHPSQVSRVLKSATATEV